MHNRVKWVDYAKAGGIFLVVAGHAGFPETIRSYIYAFHIPLFFFLSGLFFDFEKYPDYKTFFKKRFQQLVVPYLFINVVTYLVWVLATRHLGRAEEMNFNPVEPLAGILYGNADGHLLAHNVPLWFLACLFSVENLYYLAARKVKSPYRIFLLVLLLFIGWADYMFNHSIRLPWGINVAFVTVFFYGLGSISGKKIMASDPSVFKLIVQIFISFAIVVFIGNLNGKAEVSCHFYGNNFGYFIIGSLAGISGMMSLSKLIGKFRIQKSLLLYIGANTLTIYGFHLLAGTIIKGVMVYIFHLTLNVLDNLWIKTLYCIICIFILLPFTIVLNRYFPYLVGKSGNPK